VAEELARRLVDVPFLGPVLADDLRRQVPAAPAPATVAVAGDVLEPQGFAQAVGLRGTDVVAGAVGPRRPVADLTRPRARLLEPAAVGTVPADAAERWLALATVATCADLVGAARGALDLACDYAKVRSQFGRNIGSYQGVSHPLAEGLALVEGSVSVLRYAAWAVDELPPGEALHAARVAKVYGARAARTVCETAVQVHGGMGNIWDCLAHVYLRRALTSAGLFPARLAEVARGLP
jgi:hypothetical protein